MDRRWVAVMGILFVGLALAGTIVLLSELRTESRRVEAAVSTTDHLSARLPAGTVAVALSLPPVASVGGVIRPGDRVDLYGFFPTAVTRSQPTTRIILQEAVVYGVAGEPGAESITFAISPEEALLIQNALQLGAKVSTALHSGQSPPARFTEKGFSDSDLMEWILRL